MQVSETTQVTEKTSIGPRCSICEHPQLEAIDRLLASGAASRRTIAHQFNISADAVQRHKTNHLGRRLVRAAAKRQGKVDDVFMERHEDLYKVSRQYVDDAMKAVKMQKVTVERPILNPLNGQPLMQAVLVDDKPVFDAEGNPLQKPVLTTVDEYREFRDVGAMAPALGAATALQRVLGDATARFSQPAAGGVNVHLSVIMPRAVEQQPAIEASSEVVHELEVVKPESDTDV